VELGKELLLAIKQAQEGKEEGFNKIYSSTYHYVYFRSKTIMKQDDEAWDLLQEVYIVAYKSISNLERPENLYAWLGGIAYNLGMKTYRKKKDVLLDEENEGIFDEIRSTDQDIQPEEYVEHKQTGNIVKELIDQLPELQKAAVIAYYFDEMSVRDIAKVFDCSEGTIKSRLNYARQYLKQAVEMKEKKDNIKLHSVSIPTIIIALRMLSEDTVVSAQTAQSIYNGVCSSLGIKATILSTAANITNVSNLAGAGTQAIGAGTAGSGAKAAGLVAKLAAASVGTKTAAIGLVAIAGISLAIGGASMNSMNNKPAESVVAIAATPTPGIAKEEVVTATPTGQPETDQPVDLTEEESTMLNLIIHGLTDSVESGYKKGDPLTDEQKMGIAYQVFYSLCVPDGNKFGYAETEIEYDVPDFEGDALVSHAYLIPKNDMDLMLNTVIGQTISEDKNYDGFVFQYGHYYLIEACNYVGFRDFWSGDESVSYNYDKSRKFEIISTETTEKRAVQEGIREIGHADADAVETIQHNSYKIELEAVEPTKFGRYSLAGFESEEIVEPTVQPTIQPTVQPTAEPEKVDYTEVYGILKDYLNNYDKQIAVNRYKDYEYTEYFIYDWKSNDPPVLIIRDAYNKTSCDYFDIHYVEGTGELKKNELSITGPRESMFYKKDDSFIEIADQLDYSESHAAYFYRVLDGMNSEKEELWFWFKNDDTTQNLDLDSYKEKRAEVESLEQIKWYLLGDLSPFK
jgi:RNA polymerase sigma factor (sigma-70 family)